MSLFEPQNPGLGGLDELTAAEEVFLQNLAGQSYAQGDVLYHNGTALTRLPAGTTGQYLKTNGAGSNPAWETLSLAVVVLAKTDNYTVSTSDDKKVITMNAATVKTFTLPSVDSSNIGLTYTFVKLGAGKVIIDAADSDLIADSTAGGTIFDDLSNETWATITITLVSATQWVITGMDGTWITT